MPKFEILKSYRDKNSGARHLAGESVTLSDLDRISALRDGGFIGKPEKRGTETADAPEPETATEWTLKTPPAEYLERYPDGPHAETARKLVE